VLTRYPKVSRSFIQSITPPHLGRIPEHPLDRCLDLFFLNTSEHFAKVLSQHDDEEMLVAGASPYLVPGGHRNLLEIFEAAHSVMLAVFAAPQNVDLTAKVLPFYVDVLFKVCQMSESFTVHFMSDLLVLPHKPLAPSIPLRNQDTSPAYNSSESHLRSSPHASFNYS
jgi:hypothetical protein